MNATACLLKLRNVAEPRPTKVGAWYLWPKSTSICENYARESSHPCSSILNGNIHPNTSSELSWYPECANHKPQLASAFSLNVYLMELYSLLISFTNSGIYSKSSHWLPHDHNWAYSSYRGNSDNVQSSSSPQRGQDVQQISYKNTAEATLIS